MKTKKIIYVIFLIATILCAIGCGSRKTQQTKTDLNTKEVVTDNSTIETKTDTNTKVIDCTFTDEVEIIPIDNTKEIIVNGKVFKNVRLKHKKTKNNIVVDKVVKEVKKQQNDIKIKKKVSLEVKQKETEKEQFNFLSLWWVYLLIIVIIYIIYKKYKDKIWFI
jgi:hypothetical protein